MSIVNKLRAFMKNIFKTASYTLVSVIALGVFFFFAFGTGNSGSSPLNVFQVISGVALLMAAILLPAMKRVFRSAANK